MINDNLDNHTQKYLNTENENKIEIDKIMENI